MQVAPPQSNVPVVDGAPPRRTRRWWVLGALVVVSALVITLTVYVSRYEPLAVGGAYTSGQYVDPQQVDLDGDLQAYTYHEGGLIVIALSVDSIGRLPITVTGVTQSPAYWEGLISIVAPRLGLDQDATNLSASSAFQPFSLSEGGHRLIDVVFRMGHCAKSDPGTSMSMTSVTLTYTVLGIHRSQDLPLPTGIWVTAPSRADCPAA